MTYLGFGSLLCNLINFYNVFPLIIPSMLNYICICNGNLQYIDLLILFLARQSSKFSMERAVQLVENPYLGRTSTIIGWVKKGEKREKQQSLIPHGSFTTGADFGPRTLHNVMMDHCATTLKSKKLFQQCSYILLRDPEASGTTNRKGSNYYWLRTSVISASPSASHCLSIRPSTTSTPL